MDARVDSSDGKSGVGHPQCSALDNHRRNGWLTSPVNHLGHSSGVLCYDDGVDEYNEDDQSPGLGEADLFDLLTREDGQLSHCKREGATVTVNPFCRDHVNSVSGQSTSHIRCPLRPGLGKAHRMTRCALDDVLTQMIQTCRGQLGGSVKKPHDAVQVNGFDDDRGEEASRDSIRDGVLPAASLDVQLGPGGELKEFEDDQCMLSTQPSSSKLSHRPTSPLPWDGLSSQEREDLDGDISSRLDVDDGYIDDDFGLGKLPPSYLESGDETTGEQLGGGSKPLQHRDFFAVPHERAEVEKIVAEAVDIFWNLRRCGEPWESSPEPTQTLSHAVDAPTGIFCFDLTGEILREMYQYENEVEPPAWQKPVPKRQRYYKGITPPTTVDVLLPVVQTAAISILGLNGAVGKMRGKTANKWSVRKKKDHVDAVLVKELQEEEADWISYNHDETAVKLQLTDTIFESLLADTVDAINRVQTRSSCFL
ncbi:hypothetical protein C0Q70_18044 [Pomacea canaliculata]|uniref:DUF4378 domain-containing protein n=2 Tax=Pomacea canaliculata TaxID=400727 RepID=A0A2T7NM33_POMCA|nr:hypothetical protein C0Q70_18044 [Pomacea canaliculata]